MRSSKELARRLRFDRFPRPDLFRRRYLLAGGAAAVLGLVTWLGFSGALGERQYLPGPVSRNHATFGDRCEVCHDAFQAVRNESCLECHAPRVHSPIERAAPRCAECHVEHRGHDVFLAVSNASCVDCHANLETTGAPPAVAVQLASFAAHPEFTTLRAGRRDEAALRFNHRIHLTSDKIARGDELACANCHVPAADGRTMQPILFEPHCERCHRQDVPLALPGITAIHETPAEVRQDLRHQLLVLAVDQPSIFEGIDVLLPGRVQREPLDASRSLAEYERTWIARAERALYAPLVVRRDDTAEAADTGTGAGDETGGLLDENKLCFLCHLEGGAREAGALPEIAPTGIPARWLARGEFSHRAHDMLRCAHCHPGAEQSVATSDVNLPARQVCESCHRSGVRRSAGDSCMLCHLYHDTSKDPAVRAAKAKEVELDRLLGR